jgi:hypothetical protein
VGWNAFIESWRHARAELAAIERAEHPDVTDRFGRVWTWETEISGTGRPRGRYVHDGTFSADDADAVARWGLPPERLASNPNYAGLCETCRQDWPVAS